MISSSEKLAALVMIAFTTFVWWIAISTLVSGEVILTRTRGVASPALLYMLGLLFVALGIWGLWKSQTERPADSSTADFTRISIFIFIFLGIGVVLGGYAQQLALESI